jgi:hypothetical protein
MGLRQTIRDFQSKLPPDFLLQFSVSGNFYKHDLGIGGSVKPQFGTFPVTSFKYPDQPTLADQIEISEYYLLQCVCTCCSSCTGYERYLNSPLIRTMPFGNSGRRQSKLKVFTAAVRFFPNCLLKIFAQYCYRMKSDLFPPLATIIVLSQDDIPWVSSSLFLIPAL